MASNARLHRVASPSWSESSADATSVVAFSCFGTGGSMVVLADVLTGLREHGEDCSAIIAGPCDRGLYQRLQAAGIGVDALAGMTSGDDSSAACRIRGRRPGRFNKTAWLEAHAPVVLSRAYAGAREIWVWARRSRGVMRRVLTRMMPSDDSILYVNGLEGSELVVLAAKIRRRRVVIHAHMFTKWNWASSAIARLADHVICISEAIRENVLAAGVKAERASIVRNGVDCQRFAVDAAARIRMRSKWGVEDSTAKLIGVVGRLVSWKGQDVLLEALARMKISHPEVIGVVVGGPDPEPRSQEYARNLKLLAEDLGIAQTIIWAGHETDIPAAMNALDVVVVPSTSPEPFGLVLIEAMACGKPVVATASGGPVEIVAHGETGWLVKPGAVAELASTLDRILAQSASAADLGARARVAVAQRFSTERQVAEVVALLAHVRGLDVGAAR